MSYDPEAGREGIEPSLRVLEAQLVTMTLRPRRATKERRGAPEWAAPIKSGHLGSNQNVLLAAFARRLVGESNPSHPMDSGAATPVASRGEIARGPKTAPSRTSGVTYGDRTRLRGFTFHPRPRRVTSPSMAQACAGGLPWSRTTFFRSSGGRYYSTSSQPLSALGGTCTRHRALERRASWLLDDEGPEPSPGIEPDPPAYGAGARPSSRKGTQAPAEGIEPPSS